MTTFVDTSAIYALMDGDDSNHASAKDCLASFDEAERLVTHNYVVVESAALVQRRLGTAAARSLFDELLPAFDIVFVDPALHTTAARAWLARQSRSESLVDWVSFEMIRARRIERAFAFDADFVVQGIALAPG